MKAAHEGETLSSWVASVDMPACPPLRSDLKVDVCIVGAGWAGLLTAYLLTKEGKRVCVLDDAGIGAGQTGKTTAHLTVALDRRYEKLRALHGDEAVKLAASSHRAAMRKIEQIAFDENIECDLQQVRGYLFLAPGDDPEILSNEFEAAQAAGLEDVHMLPQVPIKAFQAGPCVSFPDQLQIHPLKFLKGLARKLVHDGAIICTAHVDHIQGGAYAHAQTSDGFVIRTESIVVATNSPINNLFAIHTKQAPYRSYAVGYLIPSGSVERGLYWDTASPFHYVRVAAENSHSDVLIIGGEDHKTGQEDDPAACFTRLEDWARERFAFLGTPLYRWSGQVMESMDGLAFLGRNPVDSNNVYVITGDSGNGLTHGAIGAMLITDQIQGRDNPWEELYDPGRVNLRAIKEFFSENANVAKQYGEWLSGLPQQAAQVLLPGEGLVVNRGLKKIAVYRDANGGLELHSAVCPHLGGVVAWNDVEKSWDCPCHGSRFDCHGQVIEGPATKSLSPINEPLNLDPPAPPPMLPI